MLHVFRAFRQLHDDVTAAYETLHVARVLHDMDRVPVYCDFSRVIFKSEEGTLVLPARRRAGSGGGNPVGGQPAAVLQIADIFEGPPSEQKQLTRVTYRGLDEDVTTIERHWRLPGSIMPRLDAISHAHELMTVATTAGTLLQRSDAVRLVQAEDAAREASLAFQGMSRQCA